MNPSPGFTFFDTEDGEPMAQAVARLLSSARAAEGEGIDDSVRAAGRAAARKTWRAP